jgi:hypothetical protein
MSSVADYDARQSPSGASCDSGRNQLPVQHWRVELAISVSCHRIFLVCRPNGGTVERDNDALDSSPSIRNAISVSRLRWPSPLACISLRLASWSCAARRIRPSWPLAYIQE